MMDGEERAKKKDLEMRRRMRAEKKRGKSLR